MPEGLQKHQIEWTRITIIDPRPIWADELIDALKAEGFFGSIRKVCSKAQLLNEDMASGPTLYLIGNVAFENGEFPADVLTFLASAPSKVVFLTLNPSAFAVSLGRKRIDFAARALDGSCGTASVSTIARKILQFEPALPKASTSQTKRRVALSYRPEPVMADCPVPLEGPRNVSVIGLGASTGGVEALQVLLKGLPNSLPPILIVQHSRSKTTNALTEVLNRATKIDVVTAQNNMPLMPGRAYVAAGSDYHLRLGRTSRLTSQLIEAPPVSGHRPSVDVLFESLSELGNQVAALLLTGMGQDGAVGLKRVRDRGGWTAAQDKASCVVYGMPKAAVDLGAAKEQLSLSQAATRLMELCKK